MAQKQKLDTGLATRLDELEQRMFLLKIAYEKYFGGIDPIEPVRDRDDVRRFVRDLLLVPVTNATQRYRLRTLRARWNTLDLYLTRNLVQIERGTHPKFKFRAMLAEKRRTEARNRMDEARARATDIRDQSAREDMAYRAIFDRYLEARKECGQSTDLDYDSVRKALRNQVRTIKSRYQCNSVKFRVTVEDGKARLKAVPQR